MGRRRDALRCPRRGRRSRGRGPGRLGGVRRSLRLHRQLAAGSRGRTPGRPPGEPGLLQLSDQPGPVAHARHPHRPDVPLPRPPNHRRRRPARLPDGHRTDLPGRRDGEPPAEPVGAASGLPQRRPLVHLPHLRRFPCRKARPRRGPRGIHHHRPPLRLRQLEHAARAALPRLQLPQDQRDPADASGGHGLRRRRRRHQVRPVPQSGGPRLPHRAGLPDRPRRRRRRAPSPRRGPRLALRHGLRLPRHRRARQRLGDRHRPRDHGRNQHR